MTFPPGTNDSSSEPPVLKPRLRLTAAGAETPLGGDALLELASMSWTGSANFSPMPETKSTSILFTFWLLIVLWIGVDFEK